MKINKSIFIGLICAILAAPAFAATDTSCDNDDNEFVNQRLALCSVHAYNIGATENPTDPNQKALMRDVVALKTTVMTQQMKKQYDFLEATIKRIQTQLEKAILVADLEAAGAAPAGGSSTGTTNTGLAGARDCSSTFNTRDALQCLQQNYTAIYSATSNNTKVPNTDTRKQINQDFAILDGLSVFTQNKSIYAFRPDGGGNFTSNPTTDQAEKCRTNSAGNDCITFLQNGIRKLMSAQEQSERSGFTRM